MTKPTRFEREIERTLGVSHAGLLLLARACAFAMRGKPAEVGGGMAGDALVRRGYAARPDAFKFPRVATDEGLALVARARTMGW